MSTKLEREIHRALYGNGRPRLNLETQLVWSVCEYLRDVVQCREVFRRNVGTGEWLNLDGTRRLVCFNEPGMADVWAIGPGGLHIEAECKVPGKKLRPNQQAWLDRVIQAGGIALCVHSLDELAEELEREFRARGLDWRKDWRME